MTLQDKAKKYAARTGVFSSEAREAIANDYINGYTQALSDVEAVTQEMIKENTEQMDEYNDPNNPIMESAFDGSWNQRFRLRELLTKLREKLTR